MKRFAYRLACVLLITTWVSSPAPGAPNLEGSRAKNVILLIPDGTAPESITLARWFAGGAPLHLDDITCGLVRTYCADSAVTDSAPAATAMASGYKSRGEYIGVLGESNTMPGLETLRSEDVRKPVASILEAARLKGMLTGIVCTAQFMHATPASFASHYPDRRQYDLLTEQMIYNGIDVVFGGGKSYLNDRKDKEDMAQILSNRGYTLIHSREELLETKARKIYGLFAPKDMAFDFERPESEPSLAEMTRKAIELLANQNDRGFFLMVEGSKIDWAAHANDPVGVVSDLLAFDLAVHEALQFARSRDDTVVVVCSDHCTGGLSINDYTPGDDYNYLHIDAYLNPLRKAKRTSERLDLLFDENKSNVREVFAQHYGIDDLTEEEVDAIRKTELGKIDYTAGIMMAKRAKIGFSTNGHTGGEVVLGVYAPDGRRPVGLIDNTDICRYIANTLDLDMDKANAQLFVRAIPAFEAKGASCKTDDSDPENPVLLVTKNGSTYRFPLNKSIALSDGKEVQLSGLVVNNTLETYVPQDAVDLVP